ncbi:uncharacterized protein TRIADDRAFT_59303 [Trichoplax adhaerens]|uniref:Uncharacterized protein n=1 Tax=Trichoplax adhaerens TaxID=10228 RepID=B3S4Q0_TRIAD|nr:hypothetical protein TRIADDRAFT_59303 [Trichoplax adhaerens]EDV22254.1 hypothetical protein TRIADDRAFT_59303 [Trichoplax adhaerens]|eukprot:XP_002115409.1 hypothetical protein TRIADDRAFT_59303 [Trichoplax adhaerens]
MNIITVIAIIPYALAFLLCGLPLFLIEMIVGQNYQRGPTIVFARMCPLFHGVGGAMITLCFFMSIFHVVPMVWSLHYFINSFQPVLPWTTCNNTWNTNHCISVNDINKDIVGVLSSNEYFRNQVLDLTTNPLLPGAVKIDMAVYLAICWLMVYLVSFKGIFVSGKASYVTTALSYLIIVILFIRGLAAPGNIAGITKFLWKSNISSLQNIELWGDASLQAMVSLGVGFGPIITYSSYNKRDYKFISLYVLELQETGLIGSMLVFVVYPTSVGVLQLGHLWSAMFYLMIFLIAFDNQCAFSESIASGLIDAFPDQLYNRRTMIYLVLTLVQYLLGMTCITKGGLYVFQLFDWYVMKICLPCVLIFEVFIACWIYGVKRLRKDFSVIAGEKLSILWKILWYIPTPLIVTGTTLFCVIFYSSPGSNVKFAQYWWSLLTGWLMAGSILVCILISVILSFIRAKGSIVQITLQVQRFHSCY